MQLKLVDAKADFLFEAFGMGIRRFNEIFDRANRKIDRLMVVDIEAKEAEVIAVIVSCCDTNEEAVIMVAAYLKKQWYINLQVATTFSNS